MALNDYPMIPRFEPGQLIDAARFNQIVDQLNSMRLSVTAPLASRVTPSGTELYLVPRPDRGIGKTTETISARSGVTPGNGTVQPYYFDGADLVENGAVIEVWNFTGNELSTSAIWVEYFRYNGYWFLSAADCSGVA
jgi:hypothetical protein